MVHSCPGYSVGHWSHAQGETWKWCAGLTKLRPWKTAQQMGDVISSDCSAQQGRHWGASWLPCVGHICRPNFLALANHEAGGVVDNWWPKPATLWPAALGTSSKDREALEPRGARVYLALRAVRWLQYLQEETWVSCKEPRREMQHYVTEGMADESLWHWQGRLQCPKPSALWSMSGSLMHCADAEGVRSLSSRLTV